MAKLTAGDRASMPKGAFAIPSRRAFPLNDKSHQEAAIRDAPIAQHAGNVTPSQRAMIQAKARALLNKGK